MNVFKGTKTRLTEAVDASLANRHMAYYKKDFLDSYNRSKKLISSAELAIAVLSKNYPARIGVIDFQIHDGRGYVLIKWSVAPELVDKFAKNTFEDNKDILSSFEVAKKVAPMFSKFDTAYSIIIK